MIHRHTLLTLNTHTYLRPRSPRYSENLTYADHDEIDFEFRSGISSADTDKNIWTNSFHSQGNFYDADRVCGGGVSCPDNYGNT